MKVCAIGAGVVALLMVALLVSVGMAARNAAAAGRAHMEDEAAQWP
jgi:hypothetical protein